MHLLFAEWLYSHLKSYDGKKLHDLSSYEIIFEGRLYTLEEALCLVRDIAGDYIEIMEQGKESVLSEEEKIKATRTIGFATRLWSVIMYDI